MKQVILAAFAAMGMVSSAFAVTAQSGIYVGALGGWSFPNKLNQDNLQWVDGFANSYPTSTSSNKNYTYGATLGYNYAFNSNWLAGLELSYMNFGYNTYSTNFNDTSGTETTGGNAKVKNWGLQLMATGTYLMDNGFNIFGKVGAIDQRTTANYTTYQNIPGSTYTSYSDSGSYPTNKWLPAAAIGVGYMPIQNLNIALQYERTFGDNWDDASTFTTGGPNHGTFTNSNSEPMSQNAVTLGVTYNLAI